jgi:hypothetical protein
MPWDFMVINRKMRDMAQYFVEQAPAEQGLVASLTISSTSS